MYSHENVSGQFDLFSILVENFSLYCYLFFFIHYLPLTSIKTQDIGNVTNTKCCHFVFLLLWFFNSIVALLRSIAYMNALYEYLTFFYVKCNALKIVLRFILLLFFDLMIL